MAFFVKLSRFFFPFSFKGFLSFLIDSPTPAQDLIPFNKVNHTVLKKGKFPGRKKTTSAVRGNSPALSGLLCFIIILFVKKDINDFFVKPRSLSCRSIFTVR